MKSSKLETDMDSLKNTVSYVRPTCRLLTYQIKKSRTNNRNRSKLIATIIDILTYKKNLNLSYLVKKQSALNSIQINSIFAFFQNAREKQSEKYILNQASY